MLQASKIVLFDISHRWCRCRSFSVSCRTVLGADGLSLATYYHAAAFLFQQALCKRSTNFWQSDRSLVLPWVEFGVLLRLQLSRTFPLSFVVSEVVLFSQVKLLVTFSPPSSTSRSFHTTHTDGASYFGVVPRSSSFPLSCAPRFLNLGCSCAPRR